MTTIQVLRYLQEHDISIWSEPGAQLILNPQERITPELAAAIPAVKAELLWLLERRLDPDAPGRRWSEIALRPADWEHWQLFEQHQYQAGSIDEQVRRAFELSHPVQGPRDRYGWRSLPRGSSYLQQPERKTA